MNEAIKKKIARAIDLHGCMLLKAYESASYFDSSLHHIFSVSFPADEEIKKELSGFLFHKINYRYILLTGDHASGLCHEIKKYSAWHKNQIKIAIMYRKTIKQSNTSYGVGADVNEYRTKLASEFERFNRLTRAARKKHKLGY